MNVRATIKSEQIVEVELDAEAAAQWFWSQSDEAQADFLIAVERISRESCERQRYGTAESQWHYMVGHLNTCKCSNRATREMVRLWGDLIKEPADA